MTNSMPTFAVIVNKAQIGVVSAVSHDQAMKRARTLAKANGYERFELMAQGNVILDRKARTDFATADKSYSHGRKPYATPGFEERRAALIAQYMAR